MGSNPTSAQEFTMESVERAVPQSLEDIRVTRDGTVDWYYPPGFDPNRVPDDQIYAADGSLLPEFDEFNAQYGAALWIR